MTIDIVEDGIVRFESNLDEANCGAVRFDSEMVRQYLRLYPGVIGELALDFLHSCCGQLGDNEQELDSYWAQALSQLEGHLKKVKR